MSLRSQNQPKLITIKQNPFGEKRAATPAARFYWIATTK
jgi:hypothetical protein